MAHVRFTEDFDYRVPGLAAVTIAYRAGWAGSVKKDCADKAVSANKAVRIKAPPRVRKAVSDD